MFRIFGKTLKKVGSEFTNLNKEVTRIITAYTILVEAVHTTALENNYTEEQTQALLKQVLSQYGIIYQGEENE